MSRGGRGAGSVGHVVNNHADSTPAFWAPNNGHPNANGQLVGNVGMNNQLLMVPAAAARSHLRDRLSNLIKGWTDKWGDNPFFIVIELIGDKILDWAEDRSDELLSRHPNITKKIMKILGALGVGYYFVTYFNKYKAKLLQYLMSYATTQIKIEPTEYNLHQALPTWIKDNAWPLGKEKSLAVHREALDSRVNADCSVGNPNNLVYKGSSSWTFFFYGGRFFALQEVKDENKKKFEDQNARLTSNNGTCQNCQEEDEICQNCGGCLEKLAGACNNPYVLWCLWPSTAPSEVILKLVDDIESEKSSVEAYTAVIEGTQCRWAEQPYLPPRSLESVYLDDVVKSKLVKDIAEYVHPNSQKYYSTRGIPYRRGYLLYGRPGCGKTSFAKAIAAKFKLTLCTISLLDRGMTDSLLLKLFGELSAGSLLLLEDVDCAGLSRQPEQPTEIVNDTSHQKTPTLADSRWGEPGTEPAVVSSDRPQEASWQTSNPQLKVLIDLMKADPRNQQLATMLETTLAQGLAGGKEGERLDGKKTGKAKKEKPRSMVTLAGLLNAIDGVASPSGYVLMMTTNHKDALDPALIRAGRVDMRVEFDRASQEQAKALFINMYQLVKTDDKDWIPPYDEGGIPELAVQFAERVPPRKVTCAQLQQFVLLHKTEPQVAVDGIADWITEELKDGEEEGEDESEALDGAGLESEKEFSKDDAIDSSTEDRAPKAESNQESSGSEMSDSFHTAVESQSNVSGLSSDGSDPEAPATVSSLPSSSTIPSLGDGASKSPSSSACKPSPASSAGISPTNEVNPRVRETNEKLTNDHWKAYHTPYEAHTADSASLSGW